MNKSSFCALPIHIVKSEKNISDICRSNKAHLIPKLTKKMHQIEIEHHSNINNHRLIIRTFSVQYVVEFPSLTDQYKNYLKVLNVFLQHPMGFNL